ncbi:ubiquitin-like modifier-activating enzyme 7 isoform X3 [Calypte anna]|uniref:ubiquitin-like modifier-activating enzyme 7 isoform X3 n=1 Tax=Calypte anna TaxID=9244 RepID=UPI0011C36327|nr:ubiquitin-like modifier-activating enzyme 7 isoform X3 [Calypte anna]
MYVLGDGSRRLAGAEVLVSGLRGTGAQVAAALVLAGTGRVVLHDSGTACTSDRAQQFLLGESDIGQNRAEASQRVLAELNPRVTVSAHTGKLSEDFLTSFQVVVLTESPLEEQLRIGDFCHAHGICFIVADAKGLAGQLFCDFGEHFIINSPAEGNPACVAVQHISQGNPGVVTYKRAENSPHDLFCDGTLVMFSGVEGMTELNGRDPIPVRVLDDFRLEICDTSSFSPYIRGGLVSQADAEQVLELARSLWMQQGSLDEDLVRAFASVSAGDLCPIASIIGALAAQEVLKAITGKFLPLDQWLYLDALECLALEGAATLTEEDCAPRGSRYDGQIAIFGAAFQERLAQQKYLVVGAGAIGCELLKNFAMMGLAAGPDGDLIVTDMDIVALSNLHRQFLYRSVDISEPKSVVAAAAVKHMNPEIMVTAHQNQVGPATEMLYGDEFFQHLDGVASAVDTLEARTYLERRCSRCRTPLLDSGTEGPRGNVLVMVPFLTKPHGPAGASEESSFPSCTVHNFPHTIQHTLQWALDEFEGLFQLPMEYVNAFMGDPAFLEQLPAKKALQILEQVRDRLRERPRDWWDCVRWARRHWQSCYHDGIAQLLHFYPPEHEASPGVPFWSGDKTCPHPLTFDPDNDTHMEYVLAAARLFAQVYKVSPCSDRVAAQTLLRSMVLPPFTPQERLQIITAEEQEEVQAPADHMRRVELTQDLMQQRQELLADEEVQMPLMEPIRFEKDDNIHVDFITTASNLRAENYGIPPADWLTSKRIAGRIVPAIITTTAAVAGLACLEVYKLVWGCQDLSCYRNSNLFPSCYLLLRFQPPPPHTYWYCGHEWSCWDQLEMQAVRADGQEMTVQEVLDWLQRTYGWTVSVLLCGYTMLYNSEDDEETQAQLLSQKLSETLGHTGEPLRQALELSYVCEEEDAEAEETGPPLICYLP